MKYRIGTLIHDCPEAKGRPLPHWDRGIWFIGIENILGKRQTKCRYCRRALFDPTKSNYMSHGIISLFNTGLKQQTEYPAIWIERVDLRKKEFK